MDDNKQFWDRFSQHYAGFMRRSQATYQQICSPPVRAIALFGSYGWGDGKWMRSWEARCNDDGANLSCESVICNEAPDDDALVACRELGASLA